jgi:hypothetical protein
LPEALPACQLPQASVARAAGAKLVSSPAASAAQARFLLMDEIFMLVLFFINPFRCGLKQIYRLGGFYLCRGGTYALTFGTTLKDHVPPGFHPRRAGNARIKTPMTL